MKNDDLKTWVLEKSGLSLSWFHRFTTPTETSTPIG